MAKSTSDNGSPKMTSTPWATGSDASYVEPRLIPDYQLLGRDDSGGPEWQPYTAQFGDGGYVTGGGKKHLSARGGDEDPISGTEQLSTGDARNKGMRRVGVPAATRRKSTED